MIVRQQQMVVLMGHSRVQWIFAIGAIATFCSIMVATMEAGARAFQ